MKRLLSFFAAGLLAVGSLGVMSCSGDLQNNDVQPLAIVGITNDPGNHVVPMTLDKPDGSEQSLKITFKDGFELTGADGKTYRLTDDFEGSWRKDNGNGPMTASRFKVIPPSAIKADGTPAWTDDYGSLNGDEPQYLKAGADFQKVGRRGDKGVSGDPKHIVFDGVIAGETYTLRAKYNSVSGALELKLDGTANNPAEMKLNIVGESKNFPAKDKDGNDLSYSMKQAGSTYTCDFISVADEIVEFYITNSLAGTFGGDLESGKLELNASKTTNLKFSAEKNIEYKLTVDTSKGINNATIKGEVVPMLNKATLNANWKYADNFYEVSAKDGSYQFFAENTELSLTVNRAEGDKTLAWGSSSAVTVDGDAVELAYTEKADAKPVAVKGLEAGTCYKIILETDDDNFSLKASVIKVPLADFTGMKFKGAFDGWDEANGWKGVDLAKQSDGTWTVDFLVTKDTADFDFGIYGNGDDKWCNEETIIVGNDFTKIGYGGKNAKIKGAEKDKTYTLIVKPGYGSIEAKIIEK